MNVFSTLLLCIYCSCVFKKKKKLQLLEHCRLLQNVQQKKNTSTNYQNRNIRFYGYNQMSLAVSKAWCSIFAITNTTEYATNAIFYFAGKCTINIDAHDEIHVLNASSNVRYGTRVDIFNSSCVVNVRRNGNIRLICILETFLGRCVQ